VSDLWKARVTAARRHGYICAGCERYLLLMLDCPGPVFFRDVDAALAERLKVDDRTLGRWRREAMAASLIATNTGVLSLVESGQRRIAPPRKSGWETWRKKQAATRAASAWPTS
jgi:hypothetical protein